MTKKEDLKTGCDIVSMLSDTIKKTTQIINNRKVKDYKVIEFEVAPSKNADADYYLNNLRSKIKFGYGFSILYATATATFYLQDNREFISELTATNEKDLIKFINQFKK